MDITSVDKLLLAVVFLIPGFVAMKVYSVLTSSDRLDASKALIDALAFSCLTYAAFSWAILWVRDVRLPVFHPVWFAAFCAALLFIAPTVAAVALFGARRLRWVARWLPHPVGKPWDFVFSRREQAYVIVTLNSGRRIGGFYGGESFTSSHPYEEQIFIETVWDIDDGQGFTNKHARSRGIMICGANIETIEFIGLYDDDEQREADSGDRERGVSANGSERVSADEQGGGRLPATEEHCTASAPTSAQK